MWKMAKMQYLLGISFVLPFLFAFGFYYFYTTSLLESRVEEVTLLQRDILASEIDDYFLEIELQIATTSLYIMTNPDDDDLLLSYLEILLAANPHMTSLYFGTPDNVMINASGFVPPPTFDLRTRPWYINALASENVTYTAAFLNATEDKIIVSLSYAIYNSEELLGVLAADVDIKTITTLVSTKKIAETGYAFLTDQNNQILAHPMLLDLPSDEPTLLSADEISPDLSDHFDQTGKIATTLAGVSGYLVHKTLADDHYYLCIFVPLSDYNISMRLLWLAFIVIITILLSVFILLGIAQYYFFVRPMTFLEKEITRINPEQSISYRLSNQNRGGFDKIRTSINDALAVTETYLYDLTDKMKQLDHMASFDQLTNVKNRYAYHSDWQLLDNPRFWPLAIVMTDVNNLKLFNDSFGHQKGDLVLQEAIVILKKTFGHDYIYRIGGDEFIVLVPNTSAGVVEGMIEAAHKIAYDHRVLDIVVSLSFGYAIKDNPSQSMTTLQKQAENDMYKHKLVESTSTRSRTIDTIIQTLFEKSEREENHSKRVSRICERLGEALHLPFQKVNELKTAGLLHDIGKIGIDVRILNKETRLTNEEWQIIRRHPEVGYRILSTVNELSEIATYVLSHHERYDGTGYPRGLKGEDIPIESRILALADAYDAMISYRPYRPSLTKEQALQELLKNAGTQFDAILVDLFISLIDEIDLS